MERKFIRIVRNHDIIYNRNNFEYRSHKNRADAWKAISKEMQAPEPWCQNRWKTLRDRYVKELSKSLKPSDDAAESGPSQWFLFKDMDFLREFTTPRKKRILAWPTSPNDCSNGDIKQEAKNKSYLEYEVLQNVSQSADYEFEEQISHCSYSEEQSNPIETIATENDKYENEKYESEHTSTLQSDKFSSFLDKMSNIAETRFCQISTTTSKEYDEHKGFFLMLQELFDKLPEEEVVDAKMFFLNHLHEQIKNQRNC